jgi:hypothetical protein
MALFPLGILSAAAGGVAFESDYELISTSLITTNTASIVFDVSTFGSTYKHLQIRYAGRSTRADQDSVIDVKFNTTSTTYRGHMLQGNGSTVTSFEATERWIFGIAAANATANIFGSGVIDILDPFSSSKNTTVRTLNGIHTGSYNRVWLQSLGWFDTATVTSITLADGFGSFVAGSRFSLYGIKG